MATMSEPTLELTPEQARALQTLLRRYRGRGQAALLPLLHEVQAITGWVDAPTAQAVARTLGIHDIDVHNVLEFYALFYNRPVGKHLVRVCNDIACVVAGNGEIIHALARYLDVDPDRGGTSADGRFTLELHPCLGHCERAPFLLLDEEPHGPITPADAIHLLEEAT
jgi:NADH:ubiquinone oxidoreductase subunit E